MSQPPEPNERKRHAPRHHPPTNSMAVWLPIVIAAAVVLLVLFGVWRRIHAKHEREKFAQRTSQITVNVVKVERDRKPKNLLLPGTFEAFQQTTIYPRANGYVKNWKVDIGDNVKEGQLLAEIETPEIDQQLAQARANYDLAKVTADRWRDLVEKKVVAAQEYDEKETARKTAQANVEQLEKTQNFGEITAPFSGKITARKIDTGTLVTAGTGNAGSPLFEIAQDDPLRVYVYVPQENAPSIHEGLEAKILLQEFPGQDFVGYVTKLAGALDPQSRTMQVEVQVPNHESKLYAGMFGQVKFMLVDENAPIVVPANAVMFRPDGPQVAVVTPENKIHWETLEVGRDFGPTLEVLKGVDENARVVMNPTDDLREDVQVEAKEGKPDEKKPEGEKPEQKNSKEKK